MISLILIVAGGMASGYLLRRFGISRVPERLVASCTTTTICFMLFVLGMVVGSDERIVSNLWTLGAQALLVSLAATGGSVLAARLIYQRFFTSMSAADGPASSDAAPSSAFAAMKGSLSVLLCFAAGCVTGFYRNPSGHWHDVSLWVLFALMFQVGLSVGMGENLRALLRFLQPRTLLIPVATLLSSLLFSLLAGFALSAFWQPADIVAVGGGMGYYSLSSVLVTQLKAETLGAALAAQLGTVALLANICREMLALLLAPWLARRFGPLAPVCAAGVTSVDVCLPAIARASGTGFVPVAIFHGMVLDVSIPLIFPVICSW